MKERPCLRPKELSNDERFRPSGSFPEPVELQDTRSSQLFHGQVTRSIRVNPLYPSPPDAPML